jgi:hypothetical protein
MSDLDGGQNCGINPMEVCDLPKNGLDLPGITLDQHRTVF